MKYAAAGAVVVAGVAAGGYYLTRPSEIPPSPTTATTAAMTTPTTEAMTTAATTPPEEVETTLSVFEWTGYELEQFWASFKAKYPKVKVEFSFFGDESEALSKLQAGFKPDVVHPCGSSVKRWVDAGVIQPINTDAIPNFQDIYPELIQMSQDEMVIDGKCYLIPWDWGYTSITYRPDLLDYYHVEKPDSYSILWDRRLKGMVSAMDSAVEIFPMAALVAGVPKEQIWTMTDDQLELVREKLLELKDNARTFWSDYTEVFQMLATGEVVAAETWNEIIVMLAGEKKPAAFLDPKEGRLAYVCGFSIGSGIDNLHYDLAHEYINAALAPESMAYLIDEYAYGASNKKAIALADPNTVSLLELDKPEKLLQGIFWKYSPEEEKWVEMWTEIKAG